MTRTPEERLERLIRHARLGWMRARPDEAAWLGALRWLSSHPGEMPEVDALWRECLEGRGELAEWRGALPLHTILASHPFTDLAAWSIPATSGAS